MFHCSDLWIMFIYPCPNSSLGRQMNIQWQEEWSWNNCFTVKIFNIHLQFTIKGGAITKAQTFWTCLLNFSYVCFGISICFWRISVCLKTLCQLREIIDRLDVAIVWMLNGLINPCANGLDTRVVQLRQILP
jgi:hypothetical protein